MESNHLHVIEFRLALSNVSALCAPKLSSRSSRLHRDSYIVCLYDFTDYSIVATQRTALFRWSILRRHKNGRPMVAQSPLRGHAASDHFADYKVTPVPTLSVFKFRFRTSRPYTSIARPCIARLCVGNFSAWCNNLSKSEIQISNFKIGK